MQVYSQMLQSQLNVRPALTAGAVLVSRGVPRIGPVVFIPHMGLLGLKYPIQSLPSSSHHSYGINPADEHEKMKQQMLVARKMTKVCTKYNNVFGINLLGVVYDVPKADVLNTNIVTGHLLRLLAPRYLIETRCIVLPAFRRRSHLGSVLVLRDVEGMGQVSFVPHEGLLGLKDPV